MPGFDFYGLCFWFTEAVIVALGVHALWPRRPRRHR